jgi:hypothetical protein
VFACTERPSEASIERSRARGDGYANALPETHQRALKGRTDPVAAELEDQGICLDAPCHCDNPESLLRGGRGHGVRGRADLARGRCVKDQLG